jgi:2-acylglycerol O-acyltransferase 2
MAAVSSPPLTSEPTNPIEREYQNLPPKTYTDAVESGLSVGDENAPNGVAEVNEINGIKPLNGNGINGTSEGGDTPSVLSIVNEGTSKEERQEEGSENRKTTEVYSTIVRVPSSIFVIVH